MNRRDPSKFSQYTEKEHAEPLDQGTLTCSFCGRTAVQHLAIGDGWQGVQMPFPAGGIGYVCDRDVCKDDAREKGVAV